MTMNTQDILDAFNNLRTVSNNFRDALEVVGRVIEAAVHDLKDLNEQIRVQQERISTLEEDNKRLQERLAQAEETTWQLRREARDAQNDAKKANEAFEDASKKLEESKAEGVKLREIILTVATSVDSVINPKSPASTMPEAKEEPKVLDPTDTRLYWDTYSFGSEQSTR